jgi:hypothetical protein
LILNEKPSALDAALMGYGHCEIKKPAADSGLWVLQ